MTTESDGLRQSDRVSFRMPVEASWVTAQTIQVNGGSITT